jgi:hypothetical protein
VIDFQTTSNKKGFGVVFKSPIPLLKSKYNPLVSSNQMTEIFSVTASIRNQPEEISLSDCYLTCSLIKRRTRTTMAKALMTMETGR